MSSWGSKSSLQQIHCYTHIIIVNILNDDLGQSETQKVEIQASLYDNYDIN